jgi:trehalose 6-phosphate synthase
VSAPWRDDSSPTAGVWVSDRRVHAAAYPIGIDYQEFRRAVDTETARTAFDRLRASGGGAAHHHRRSIGSITRRGFPTASKDIGASWRSHAECQGQVFLLQIAPPSRGEVHTYESIRQDPTSFRGASTASSRSVDWVPIRYVNQGYPREELAGFYRAARSRWSRPLRDGMNLVAKEYVAAQDPEDPAVSSSHASRELPRQLKDAASDQPLQQGRDQRRHPPGAEDAEGGTGAALAGDERERDG